MSPQEIARVLHVDLEAVSEAIQSYAINTEEILGLHDTVSRGQTPEAQALAITEPRVFGRDEAEGCLFTLQASEVWLLIIVEDDDVVDVLRVDRATLRRDLQHVIHEAQRSLKRLSPSAKGSFRHS